MEIRSSKLRTLIMLRTLYKYTDKNHRMNSIQMNEHLKPYGLDSKRSALCDTVKILRILGIDVKQRIGGPYQGVWIEDSLISDEVLEKILYAVSSHPELTEADTKLVRDGLRPLMTVYQEKQFKKQL